MVYMVIGFGVLSIILVCTTAYYYAAYKDEENLRVSYQTMSKDVLKTNVETFELCEKMLKSLTDARLERDMYKKELDELKSLTRGKFWECNDRVDWCEERLD